MEIVLSCTIPGRGLYRITTETLDRMIAKYLPASVEDLCREIDRIWSEEWGEENFTPAIKEIHTVTEALFVLAELNGLGR
ncbi:hypothetical protein AB0G06_43545 [Nonomuraea dietziae]|uniref:hypothetical protein n=1 Tax=Nonomuraea dietziae TaxID=65515 RepID=UPI0033DF3E63